MKKKYGISFLLFLFLFSQQSDLSAQNWSEKMAKTVMTIWKDSLYTDPVKPAKWTYDQGVILKGIEGLWLQTGDPKYFNYMQHSMDFFVDEKGNIRTYKASDDNLDNLLCGRMLITLYQVTGKEKYYKAACLLRAQLDTQPRTQEGGFWHKKIYPYQMWLDGLYMAEPFYAEYAKAFHKPEDFTDIAHQFIWMEIHALDKKTGLLYHGWDESKAQKWANPQTGCSPNFWARAMAWYGMALVDVLENFPDQHPAKDSLKNILKRFVKAIARTQDPVTGLWYDILNLPQARGNYPEASASSMFVCAIAKGVRLGLLPAADLSIAKKGYAGILKKFVKTDADGMTVLDGTVSVSGLGGKPYRDGSYAYYMREKVVRNDPKGMGAFLQAANEMEAIADLQKAKGKSVLLDDYFNAERKKDVTGALVPFHYKWDEWDNGGFSLLGHLFRSTGMKTKTLSTAPSRSSLKTSDIYIIVDADNESDHPDPHFMTDADASVIYDWVKAGGVLLILHNDKGNADFAHINQLSDRFGIHFNEDSYNRVIKNDYTGGAIEVPGGNPVLPHEKRIYQKEICSITLQNPAKALLKKDNLVILAAAQIGKGKVLATGDPWLYNEYTDGRKLPLIYENFGAAKDLISWLIQQIPSKQNAKKPS